MQHRVRERVKFFGPIERNRGNFFAHLIINLRKLLTHSNLSKPLLNKITTKHQGTVSLRLQNQLHQLPHQLPKV
jgi:hypothetical protein